MSAKPNPAFEREGLADKRSFTACGFLNFRGSGQVLRSASPSILTLALYMAFDADRYEEWVKRSFRWVRDESRDLGLPHHVQLLGIVDAEIRGLRRDHIFDDEGKPREDENGVLVLEHAQIYAHLWVLGAYEYVRMVAQRVRTDPSLATDESIESIQKTKRLFERVRIPLAKFEPATRHKGTDFSVALPGIGDKGLGWKVSDGIIVFQEDLSDAFLQMLSAIRPKQ